MGLKRTKLQVQSVTGITTVGIFTVGVTNTGGPVGVASTTYVRGVIMHNTGLGTATSSCISTLVAPRETRSNWIWCHSTQISKS